MPFDSYEEGLDGPAAIGSLKSGRFAAIRIIEAGTGLTFRAEVSPLDGCQDDRAVEIEMHRVIQEAESVERALAVRFGTPCEGPVERLLAGAADHLDGVMRTFDVGTEAALSPGM